MMQTSWKLVSPVFNKLELDLPHNSVIPLLGIFPKAPISFHTDTWPPMFTGKGKQPSCPSTEECIMKIGKFTYKEK